MFVRSGFVSNRGGKGGARLERRGNKDGVGLTQKWKRW